MWAADSSGDDHMADDITPGEASVLRDGPQMNLQEARAFANETGRVRDEASQKNADRDVTESPVRDHLAATSKPAARGASGGAGNAHVNEQSPDERPFTDSETALGGADSVQKTTWGVGHGTEPTGEDYMPVGRKKGEGPVVARVSAGGGMSPIALVVGVLGLLALLVYAFGAFRG
jgi:hypothetical protein